MAAKGVGPGTRGTCRHCGQPVQAQAAGYSWGRVRWHHPDGETSCGLQDRPYQKGEPKEYCTYVKNDGDQCLRAVKHEDIAAELFACGFHMRQEAQQKAVREATAKRAAERAQEEEIEQWELDVYMQAEEYLRNVLPAELFGDQHAYRSWGHSGRKSIDKVVELDWFQLRQAIRELVEKVHGERTD